MVCLQVVTERWDPISAAIRFSTRSWASHAEFVDERGITLGARARGGVKFRGPSESHYSRIERYDAEGLAEAFDWAITQIGKPYDFGAVAGIAFDRNWRDTDRWFCSELAAAAFEHAGRPLFARSADVWRITPRDLLLSRELRQRP
jgi:hypothetical protein